MALQGTLDTFALADLVRLLATTNKTGELTIEGDRGRGSLWFVDGALVAGDPAGADVTDAVFALLRFEDGDFSFSADTRADDAAEPQSALDALGRAEARLEEWLPVEKLVPTPEVTLALRDDLPEDEVTIDRDLWRQVRLVAGGTTAGEFGAALSLDEVATGFAVHALVATGLVEVGEPVAPAPVTVTPEPSLSRPGAAPLATDAGAPDDEAPLAPVDEAPLAPVVPLGGPAAAAGPDDDARYRLGDWEDPEVLAQPLLPATGEEVAVDEPSGLGPWEPLTPAALDPRPEAEAEIVAGPAPVADPAPEVAAPVPGASLDVDLDRQLAAPPGDHSYLGAAGRDGALPEPLLSAPEALLSEGVGPEPVPERPWAGAGPTGDGQEALSPAAARAVAAAAASDEAEDDDAGRRVLRRIISTGKG